MGDSFLSSDILWQFAEPYIDNGHGDQLKSCMVHASSAHAILKTGQNKYIGLAREYLERAIGYTSFTRNNEHIREVDDYLGVVESELKFREKSI